jgi:hypothetical protein
MTDDYRPVTDGKVVWVKKSAPVPRDRRWKKWMGINGVLPEHGRVYVPARLITGPQFLMAVNDQAVIMDTSPEEGYDSCYVDVDWLMCYVDRSSGMRAKWEGHKAHVLAYVAAHPVGERG